MAGLDYLWKGTRHAKLFEELPRNDDQALRAHDICPKVGSLKWRKVKRYGSFPKASIKNRMGCTNVGIAFSQPQTPLPAVSSKCPVVRKGNEKGL